MAYTVHDTPEVVRRIERDLGLVLHVVRQTDPQLRALVLTGGFARGEGAVRDGAPQNDYDLVAFRGRGASRMPYGMMRAELEERIGLHIDLAPIGVWRIPWLSRSIFWYETALRGRVLWGEDVLARIPVRAATGLEPTEGLRLLVNRAAGLLLATRDRDTNMVCIQSAKALLGALDVHLLAHGMFPPSHTERWRLSEALTAAGEAPPGTADTHEATAWAYHFKVDPDGARWVDPDAIWTEARHAVLQAVPVALRHAGIPSLDAYARRDGILDHLYYQRHAGRVPGAKRLVRHPTARVRVATLRLLERAEMGSLPPEWGVQYLDRLTSRGSDPVAALEALRAATLQ